MKTFMLRKEDVEHKWYIIDAEGKTLGKVAAAAALVLRSMGPSITRAAPGPGYPAPSPASALLPRSPRG